MENRFACVALEDLKNRAPLLGMFIPLTTAGEPSYSVQESLEEVVALENPGFNLEELKSIATFSEEEANTRFQHGEGCGLSVTDLLVLALYSANFESGE